MIFQYKDKEPIRHILFHNQRNERIEHVIVFLCGKGQRGQNLQDLFETGLPKVLRNNPDFELPNTVVVCCQLPSSGHWVWNDDDLASILMGYVRNRWANSCYHITGLSLGGQGSLYVADLYGVDSVGVMAGFTWNKEEAIDSLHSIPTYFVHGENDKTVNDSARYVADTLIEKGEDCEYHLLDMGHNVWDWAYDIDNNQGYLNWFRNKFLSNGGNTPDDPKEFIPVDLNSLKQGDFVISPNGDEYMVSGMIDQKFIIAIRSDVINENWEVRNPNYQL